MIFFGCKVGIKELCIETSRVSVSLPMNAIFFTGNFINALVIYVYTDKIRIFKLILLPGCCCWFTPWHVPHQSLYMVHFIALVLDIHKHICYFLTIREKSQTISITWQLFNKAMFSTKPTERNERSDNEFLPPVSSSVCTFQAIVASL